ncbi:MAG: GntR family transcriptional regulator [Alphaproteobacteria bacterium]|nr:GntR family transcriptional regulator [Alphaproteobacteria bacterium]
MRSRSTVANALSRAPKVGQSGSDRTAGEAGALGRFRSPLYHQIYLIMRQRIADGEFGTSGTVPSEQELAEFHGVSRITAKRALDELAKDGLVVRERGRGTRLVEGRTGVRISGQGTGAFDPLLAMGGATEVMVKEFGYGPAVQDVADALGIRVGTPVQRAVRVRSVGGDPFSHLTTYVPEEIGRTFDRADLAETPLLSLFERAGIVPADADQTVTATLADMVVAQRLNVDVGAPLLRTRRVVRDRDGRSIELLVALYRSDLYRLSMTLSRGDDPETEWSADAVSGIPAPPVDSWRAVGDGGK